MLLAERHESERLREIIKELQRHRFGRKAVTLPEEQMLLGLEDVQQAAACTEASQDETAPEGRAERARKRRNNRGALPAHLHAYNAHYCLYEIPASYSSDRCWYETVNHPPHGAE